MKLILYVENSPGLVRFADHLVKGMGYDFEAAASNAEAIVRIDRDPLPNLVLCDLLLNDENGLEVLKHMTASRFDSVPIVVLTGSTKGAARQAIRATGNFRHYQVVVKPEGFGDLGDLLRALVTLYLDDRWLML